VDRRTVLVVCVASSFAVSARALRLDLEFSTRDPRVAELLKQQGGRLAPRTFHPERRAWVLDLRRGDDGPPAGLVFVSEDGRAGLTVRDEHRDGGAPQRAPRDDRRRERETERRDDRPQPRANELERF
jgi:hypothetical protein